MPKPVLTVRTVPTVRIAILLCGTMLLCGAVAGGNPDEVHALEYRIAYEPESSRLRVRLCVKGFEAGTLVTDYDETLKLLGLPADVVFNAGRADATGTTPNGAPGAYGVTPPSMPGGCFEYTVLLAKLAEAGPQNHTATVGADWLTMPTRWLLRPPRRPAGTLATVVFVLPDGFAVSAPWQRAAEPGGTADGTRYLLDEGVWRLEGRLAIGRFQPQVLSLGGTRLEIAVLDAEHRASDEGIRRWIGEAGRATATLFGRFPAPRAQVLVQPVDGGGSPVVFGMSRQGGGGSVLLYLAARADDDDLPGEWVAVHELTHLALPPMPEQDAWFFEGVVSYYQEVLRARAGMMSEREAWQSVHDGFLRGMRRRSTRTLAEESTEMRRNHAYHRVYWAGAALAFRWDVTLRRAGPGASLDEALRALRERPDAVSRLWSAREACEVMERETGRSFCSATAEKWLASSDFPAFDDLYAALGIRVQDDTVVLADDAPDVAIRRAIMAPRSSRPTGG